MKHKSRPYENISEEEMNELLEKIKSHQIPEYLLQTYPKFYNNRKFVDLLDRNTFALLFSIFQKSKLEKLYLSEFSEKHSALQIGNVYGSLIKKLADKVTRHGNLDIIDVIPYQLHKVQQKLMNYKNIDMWLQDAKTPIYREYNTIGLYFVLHETPDTFKKYIIESTLKHIDEFDSKVVFIDYHNPHFLNPLQGIYKLVNFIYEPYAQSLLDKEISDFTVKAYKYKWEKTTIFGGIYQKVVLTKAPKN